MKPTAILIAAAAVQVGVMGSFALRAQSAAPAPQAESRIDFQKDIVPILATHCTSCHAGSKPRGGMSLTFKDEAEARARLKNDDEFWDPSRPRSPRNRASWTR